MKAMSSQDIVSMRLQHQQIAAPAFTEPGKVVEWMGCLQAQDYAMASHYFVSAMAAISMLAFNARS